MAEQPDISEIQNPKEKLEALIGEMFRLKDNVIAHLAEPLLPQFSKDELNDIQAAMENTFAQVSDNLSNQSYPERHRAAHEIYRTFFGQIIETARKPESDETRERGVKIASDIGIALSLTEHFEKPQSVAYYPKKSHINSRTPDYLYPSSTIIDTLPTAQVNELNTILEGILSPTTSQEPSQEMDAAREKLAQFEPLGTPQLLYYEPLEEAENQLLSPEELQPIATQLEQLSTRFFKAYDAISEKLIAHEQARISTEKEIDSLLTSPIKRKEWVDSFKTPLHAQLETCSDEALEHITALLESSTPVNAIETEPHVISKIVSDTHKVIEQLSAGQTNAPASSAERNARIDDIKNKLDSRIDIIADYIIHSIRVDKNSRNAFNHNGLLEDAQNCLNAQHDFTETLELPDYLLAFTPDYLDVQDHFKKSVQQGLHRIPKAELHELDMQLENLSTSSAEETMALSVMERVNLTLQKIQLVTDKITEHRHSPIQLHNFREINNVTDKLAQGVFDPRTLSIGNLITRVHAETGRFGDDEFSKNYSAEMSRYHDTLKAQYSSGEINNWEATRKLFLGYYQKEMELLEPHIKQKPPQAIPAQQVTPSPQKGAPHPQQPPQPENDNKKTNEKAGNRTGIIIGISVTAAALLAAIGYKILGNRQESAPKTYQR